MRGMVEGALRAPKRTVGHARELPRPCSVQTHEEQRMRITSRCIAVAAMALACLLLGAKPSLADWTAYAVDGRGKLGHGRAQTPEQASDYALGYCGSPRCYIVMTSPARCVALATSNFKGFWVGTGAADSSQEASRLARRFCSGNAPRSTCNVNHTYCQ